MGDANPIRTLRDYSKPSHEGYRNTIELPEGNNVVPLLSDTIRLVQNGCSFHGLQSEDPNQHLKDFLKLVDSLDLDGANRERMRLQDLALYDNESWNDPRDFAKPVKAISLPQDVPSTSDRHLIELEHQVQCLMEAYIAPMQPTQVNKITTYVRSVVVPMTLSTAWKIPSKLLLNMHPRVSTKREDWCPTSWHQDARLSKFEADFKQQQSEMTNKIDTEDEAKEEGNVKSSTTEYKDHEMTVESKEEFEEETEEEIEEKEEALPSDTVKNPKLNVDSTSLVWSAHSYQIEDPQCSTQIHGSINTITVHQSNPHNNKPEDDEQKGEGNPKNTNAAEREEEQRDAPQPELKDRTDIKKISPSRHDEERGIEWLDDKEPLDLVDTRSKRVTQDTIMLGPEYVTGIADEGEVTMKGGYANNGEKVDENLTGFYSDTVEEVRESFDCGNVNEANQGSNNQKEKSEGIKFSYAKIVNNSSLDNKLNLIPTEINDDGVEVVIFDEEIVKEWSKNGS
ncbi:hypothetical protein Tco_0389724 [Tanacetum coccineum]